MFVQRYAALGTVTAPESVVLRCPAGGASCKAAQQARRMHAWGAALVGGSRKAGQCAGLVAGWGWCSADHKMIRSNYVDGRVRTDSLVVRGDQLIWWV